MSLYFKNESLDLGYIWSRIRAHWYYFVISIPIIVSMAFIYARGLDRVYAFSSSLIINTRRSGPTSAGVLLDVGEGFDPKIETENEIGIISSVTMIERAMRKLGIGVSYSMEKKFKRSELYKNAPFKVLLDSSAQQLIGVKYNVTILSDTDYKISFEAEQAKGYIPEKEEVTDFRWSGKFEKTQKFGEPIKKEFINLTIIRNEKVNVDTEARYYFVLSNLYDAAKGYKNKLKVKPLEKDSYILQLETQGTNSQKEIDILNSLMEVFIERDVYEKNYKGVKTLDFTQAQLKEALENLSNAQAQLEGYKTNKQLVAIDVQSNATIYGIEKLETDKSSSEVRLNYYKNILSIINNDNLLADAKIPSMSNIIDPTLSGFLNQFANLHQQKVTLEISSGEKRAILQEVKTNMNTVRNLMRDYLTSSIKNFDIEMRNYNQRLGDFRSRAEQLPQSQVVLSELQRKYDFAKQRYEFILAKKEEADISLATSTPDIRIVDKARLISDTPVSPNTRFIYIMSLLAAIGLPLGLIIVKDAINDRVRSKEELFEHTQIPLAGVFGSGGKGIKVVLIEQPRTLIAETVRSLRTNLDYLGENVYKIIGITSHSSFEGKTFCAVNISASFALAGRKTILICADLRKSSIKNYFNVQEDGLSNFLASYLPSSTNALPLQAVIQRTEIPNLDIIPSGMLVSNPSELLSSEIMLEMIEDLKLRYDKIIIDTPPISFVSDYFTLNKLMDLTLYVVRANRTKFGSLEEINKLTNSGKLKNVKILLNDFKFSSSYETSYHKGGYA
jgi:capsular exopolysaccharide synthesis family protein